MKEFYQTENSRISPTVLSEAYIGGATHLLQNLREQKGPCTLTGQKLADSGIGCTEHKPMNTPDLQVNLYICI